MLRNIHFPCIDDDEKVSNDRIMACNPIKTSMSKVCHFCQFLPLDHVWIDIEYPTPF